MNERMRSVAALAGFIALVALTAWFGARFEPGAWYAALEKPPLTPPNWVFGPVWSALYLTISVAAWLVWRQPVGRAVPLVLWAVQLALNAAWSLIFFGLNLTALALVEIACLLLAIAATTVSFWRTRPLAGALLLPYLAWVGFAAYLNAGIWLLNR